jgi:hypothetical protein
MTTTFLEDYLAAREASLLAEIGEKRGTRDALDHELAILEAQHREVMGMREQIGKPPEPGQSVGPPLADKPPRRKRRTKAEIAADKARTLEAAKTEGLIGTSPSGMTAAVARDQADVVDHFAIDPILQRRA